MKRRVQRLKAAIVRGTKHVIRFMGPVAGAVHGELSKPEVARSVVKAVVVAAGTKASMTATITQPNVVTDIVVPLGAAILTGTMDAMSRLEQGAHQLPAPPVLTPLPPVPPQPPADPPAYLPTADPQKRVPI